jgi:hypothetical protein
MSISVLVREPEGIQHHSREQEGLVVRVMVNRKASDRCRRAEPVIVR